MAFLNNCSSTMKFIVLKKLMHSEATINLKSSFALELMLMCIGATFLPSLSVQSISKQKAGQLVV